MALHELHMDFEEKFGVAVNLMSQEEISQKYGYSSDEIEEKVINNNGQTLPQELLVIEKDGKPYIFHAKNPYNIIDELTQSSAERYFS